jgi:hypothetical protein
MSSLFSGCEASLSRLTPVGVLDPVRDWERDAGPAVSTAIEERRDVDGISSAINPGIGPVIVSHSKKSENVIRSTGFRFSSFRISDFT